METFQLNDKHVSYLFVNNELYIQAKELLTAMEYKDPKTNLKRLFDNQDKIPLRVLILKYDLSLPKIRRNYDTIFINKKAILNFVTKTKQRYKIVLLNILKERFGISSTIFTRLTKEQEYISCICKAFAMKRFERQFEVNGYYIDLYLIDEKIAVECDEKNHVDRDQEYEKYRETSIKNTLGCKFIRFNPDDKEFDIFKVIHDIIILLMQ